MRMRMTWQRREVHLPRPVQRIRAAESCAWWRYLILAHPTQLKATGLNETGAVQRIELSPPYSPG